MASPRRLRRAGLVVVLALGLLSMHGIAAASPATGGVGHNGERAGAASADMTPADMTPADMTPAGMAPAGMAPAGMATAGGLDHQMHRTGSGHDPLHAIGQACLWLLAGGALLFLVRQLRRLPTVRLADMPRGPRLERTPRSTFEHPPDPRLATVTLRC